MYPEVMISVMNFEFCKILQNGDPGIAKRKERETKAVRLLTTAGDKMGNGEGRYRGKRGENEAGRRKKMERAKDGYGFFFIPLSATTEFLCDFLYNTVMNRFHTRFQGSVFRSVLRQEIGFFSTNRTGRESAVPFIVSLLRSCLSDPTFTQGCKPKIQE